MNLPIFVYGTLKRGECRAGMWPCRPLRVTPAWTFGELYELGEYPGLVQGSQQICGEIWFFAAEQLQRTLEVLDEIEGYVAGGPGDLYLRQVKRCYGDLDQVWDASAYLFNQSLEGMPRLSADHDGWVRWNAVHRVRA